ncbi:MAG: hypothetical protein ACLR2O_05725 [Coprococcus sp.]
MKTVENGSHSENYTYDIWGNVTKVTENSSQTGKAYAYDAQGQLIREYDPDKKVWLGYKYDAGGNFDRSAQLSGSRRRQSGRRRHRHKEICLWHCMEGPADSHDHGRNNTKLYL